MTMVPLVVVSKPQAISENYQDYILI